MNEVIRQINEAIRSKRWLEIIYENGEKEQKNFWIAILDITPDQHIIASAYNQMYLSETTTGIIEVNITISKIISARVLKSTTYEQAEQLLIKIENNPDDYSWLNFSLYNDAVLDYIEEAITHEQTPYQKELTLVSGIDESDLKNCAVNGEYILSLQQTSELVSNIETLSNQDESKVYEITTLALNIISINHETRGNFVVAYRELNFNPLRRALVLDPNTKLNYDFVINSIPPLKHTLRYYLEEDAEEFAALMVCDLEKAKNLLQAALKNGEVLDDRPYIMDLSRRNLAYVAREIETIKYRKINNALSIPLKAFFGERDFRDTQTRKDMTVVALDDKINVDQLRVIYNALYKSLTYVQGPPGTGKTSTIINVLISAFFNKQTVLVSSNNNKPIDDIYAKTMSIKNGKYSKSIPLPFLRIGNRRETEIGLKNIKDLLKLVDFYQIKENRLDQIKMNNVSKLEKINKVLQTYEERIELEEEKDILDSFKNSVEFGFYEFNISLEISDIEQRIEKLENYSEDDIKNVITIVDDNFKNWLFFNSIKHLKKLKNPDYSDLLTIINMPTATDEDIKKQVTTFNNYISDNENLKKLQAVFPVILTTNSSSHNLGTQATHFDLVVIDEAGACSIGPSLFTIARGKRALLVGDRSQLRPVVTIEQSTNEILMDKHGVESSFDYTSNSILSLMQNHDTISKYIMLRDHYRSHPLIINFSNKKYYQSKLRFPDQAKYKLVDNALEIINVDTSSTSRPIDRNVSLKELEAIISDIETNNYKNVGIITPFRNQATALNEVLEQRGMKDVKAGTVHTFQGDETSHIYFSTSVTPHSTKKAIDWMSTNKELINVATTRAKDKFTLVGDFALLESKLINGSDLSDLITYMKKQGKDVVIKESNVLGYVNGANYKEFNIKKEQELFETINHVLSKNNHYEVVKSVKMSSVLNQFIKPEYFDYGTRSVFDLVIFTVVGNSKIPTVVIEVDGLNHKTNKKTIAYDEKKEQICRANNIKLIRIGNDYSRRYEFVKNSLVNILNIYAK